MNARIPTILTPPASGQVWAGQGGIYAGVMRGAPGQPAHHLIVANAPAAEVADIAWGGYGKASEATCEWDGLANTLALVKSRVAHPAAQAMHGLEIEGHKDFYLMSRREARLCWANVPELFDASKWYWTSTQYSAHGAWSQVFAYGNQYDFGKGYAGRARAVRRLVLGSFSPLAVGVGAVA